MRFYGKTERAVPPNGFAHLGTYDDIDTYGALHADLFAANSIPVDELVITEGKLLVVEKKDIGSIESRFAPSARFAVDAY